MLQTEIEITGEGTATAPRCSENNDRQKTSRRKQLLAPNRGFCQRIGMDAAVSSCFAKLYDFVTLTEEHKIIPEGRVSCLNGMINGFGPTYQILPPRSKRPSMGLFPTKKIHTGNPKSFKFLFGKSFSWHTWLTKRLIIFTRGVQTRRPLSSPLLYPGMTHHSVLGLETANVKRAHGQVLPELKCCPQHTKAMSPWGDGSEKVES